MTSKTILASRFAIALVSAVLMLLAASEDLSAQTYSTDLHAFSNANYGSSTKNQSVPAVTKGSDFRIVGVSHELENKTPNRSQGNYIDKYYIITEGDTTIEIDGDIGNKWDIQYSSIQDYWDALIIKNVLGQLAKKGIQNDLREEMETDVIQYVEKAKSVGLEFIDPYLEKYLYSLIAKIAPRTIIDGRPGNVSLLVLNDASLTSCMYPNGTLVISTGLLAALHSEAELVAVLSHEIAHFVLDHSVQNVNELIARQNRAAFWAGMATVLTAVAEIAVASSGSSSSSYYVPGAATAAVAVASNVIAAQVNARLGMEYNHEQEKVADAAALEILRLLGYDTNALSTALNRMSDVYVNERSKAMYFASYSHPSLMERIESLGTPLNTIDTDYEKLVSFAVTSVARMKFQNMRFRQALPLLEQNISNNVATPEDYVLMATGLLNLYNDDNHNHLADKYIRTAKALDPTDINIYKTEILVSLCLKQDERAISLLDDYLVALNKMKAELKDINSDLVWAQNQNFVATELSWVYRMRIKLQGVDQSIAASLESAATAEQ